MSTDRDTTRIVRSWLTVEENESADRVLGAVLDRLDATPQRRTTSWSTRRFPDMNTMMKYGLGAVAAVAAVALVGVVALNGNVGAAPLPSETPDTTYTSERHDYTVVLPDESWEIVERPGIWAEATAFSEESSGLDVARKVGESELWVLLTSQPLDLERDEWLVRYDGLSESRFPHCPVGSSESRTVDGEQARITRYACDPGSDGVEAIMFHGDRAFAVRVFHGADETYDSRPLLDEFLDTFRFGD
jgi:hypothetical protein